MEVYPFRIPVFRPWQRADPLNHTTRTVLLSALVALGCNNSRPPTTAKPNKTAAKTPWQIERDAGRRAVDLGNVKEAEARFKKAIEEASLLVKEPAKLTESLNDLARIYFGQGMMDKAVPYLKRAVKVLEDDVGKDHVDVGAARARLGLIYADQGLYADAEKEYRKALAILEKKLGRDHLDLSTLLNRLAIVCSGQGKFDAAKPMFERALRIREQSMGGDHLSVAEILNNLAILYLDLEDYASAEPLVKRALAIRRQSLPADHVEVAASEHSLAMVERELGHLAEADTLFKSALAIREQAHHPDAAVTLTELAVNDRLQDKLDEAEDHAGQALELLTELHAPEHMRTNALGTLAAIRRAQGKTEEAREIDEQVLEIMDRLATTLETTHHAREAQQVRERAKVIRSKLETPAPM